jgi:hypothetical protein
VFVFAAFPTIEKMWDSNAFDRAITSNRKGFAAARVKSFAAVEKLSIPGASDTVFLIVKDVRLPAAQV